jgi:hypothetical protein
VAEVPFTDESARAILEIFADKNVRGGEALMAGAVNLTFLQNPKHRAEDYAAGLSYAVEKGWIVPEGRTKLRLTESGFKECR